MTERELLAAETALRLLEGEEWVQARALMAADPEFAAEVAAWGERLAPLFDEIAAAPAPADLWDRLMRRLNGIAPATVHRLEKAVTRWRLAAGLSSAAAAVLLALQFAPDPRPAPPAPPPVSDPDTMLVASLAAEGSGDALTLTFRPRSSELVTTVGRNEAGADRARQLWLIPADGQPISLGLAAATNSERRIIAPNIARQLVAGATVAISDEPAGGSPTGQPTGAVLATATLSRI